MRGKPLFLPNMRFGLVLFGLVNDTEASVFCFYPLRVTTDENKYLIVTTRIVFSWVKLNPLYIAVIFIKIE